MFWFRSCRHSSRIFCSLAGSLVCWFVRSLFCSVVRLFVFFRARSLSEIVIYVVHAMRMTAVLHRSFLHFLSLPLSLSLSLSLSLYYSLSLFISLFLFFSFSPSLSLSRSLSLVGHLGPSIKYVTIQEGRVLRKCDSLGQGSGWRSCDVTLSFFFTIHNFTFYFIFYHAWHKFKLQLSPSEL